MNSASPVHEAPWAMMLPMGLLAFACFAIGVWPSGALRLVASATVFVSGLETVSVQPVMEKTMGFLTKLGTMACLAILVVTLLAILRAMLLRKREVRRAPTWDCGYALPSARMQYSASSFAQPLMALFRSLIKRHIVEEPVRGYFPSSASWASETPDMAKEYAYKPLFTGIASVLERLRWLQQGRLQLYLLTIFFTLTALLIWKFGW